MLKLSSVSREGVAFDVYTDHQDSHREFLKGRATVVMRSGDCTLQTYPTAADLRALAAELIAAADRVEA